MTKKPAFIIPLTPNYRLTSDSLQFIVEERYISQPAVNPPADYVYVPTEKWREIGYYSIRPDSLALAVNTVILREAVRKTADVPVQSLTDFAAAISELSEQVSAAINSVLLPQKYGELATAVRAWGIR